MENQQATNTVLMISPTAFNYNPKTATNNLFQKQLQGLTIEEIREKALREFGAFVYLLKKHGVEVHVEEDTQKASPDAVFPNNWISFHQSGKVVVYPMQAENRRLERRPDIVASWRERLRAEVVDYSDFEKEGKFLEGTGSLVLDRVNRIAYACESERTNTELVQTFCEDFAYKPIIFKASQLVNGELYPIYHTNVMLAIGDSFAVACLDTVRDKSEQTVVRESLEKSGKEIIPITEDQMNKFAANILQLNSKDGKKLLIASTQAHSSYSEEQLLLIRKHCDDILHTDLETIETLGGGGARCMIAEVFPPQ